MPPSSFLTELHSRFGAPRDLVLEVAERATGRRLENLQRVVNGYDNEVYRAEFADGAAYVRIGRHAQSDFEQEAWAMQQARTTGVPVPEILELGRITPDDGVREIMVVRAAAGRPLETVLDALTDQERHQAMIALGETLRSLHDIDTPGMWRPDARGRWPDVDELRRGYIADRRDERGQLVRAGLTDAEIEQTYLLLEEFPGRAPIEPVLCHGDLRPDHIFLDDDCTVSALIDWGMWHGGSVIGEFADLSQSLTETDLDAVLAGQGAGTMNDPVLRRDIAVWVANQLIGHIAHHVTIGDLEGTRSNVAHLRSALSELRHQE